MLVRAFTAVVATLWLFCTTGFAQPQSAEPTRILFQNVRVFDGKSHSLSAAMDVLVRGTTIAEISRDPITLHPDSGTKTIVGGGRTLMPGLIDAHWHAMMVRPTVATLLAGDVGYLNLIAGAEATDTLMR